MNSSNPIQNAKRFFLPVGLGLYFAASPLFADQFGNFTYVDNGDSITITDYPDNATGPLDIPSTIIGKPVDTIGDNAFDECKGVTSINIPNSITTIGNWAFADCYGLTSLTIPSSVKSIGDAAFLGCYDLTASVTVPSGVTSIGTTPFFGCRLTDIVVDPANSNYSSVNGVLFNKSQTILLEYPYGRNGDYVIPSGTTSIGDKAFSPCSNLAGITIPTSVVNIGNQAFVNCSGLTSLTIPSGVTTIGDGAFIYCTGIRSVTISSTVANIGIDAFFDCQSLSSVTFLGGAPLIGYYAFEYCSSDFTIYYFNGAQGFTSPTWDGYPAVSIGVPSPISNWLLSNGLSPNSNLLDDSNGDGVNLLMAYALNLNPNLNLSASIPLPSFVGNQISLAFQAGVVDVTYAVEASTDLKNWTTDGVTISPPDSNGFRTATVPMNSSARFVRLVISH